MKWIGLLSDVAYFPFSWAARDSTSCTKCSYSSDPSREGTLAETKRITSICGCGQEIVDGLVSVQNAFRVIHALN